jgi:hypothetical protein
VAESSWRSRAHTAWARQSAAPCWIAAAIAIGTRETRDAAARWLRIVLGDPDLDFELRLYCEELLGILGEPTTPLADRAPRDLLSEIGAVLQVGGEA